MVEIEGWAWILWVGIWVLSVACGVITSLKNQFVADHHIYHSKNFTPCSCLVTSERCVNWFAKFIENGQICYASIWLNSILVSISRMIRLELLEPMRRLFTITCGYQWVSMFTITCRYQWIQTSGLLIGRLDSHRRDAPFSCFKKRDLFYVILQFRPHYPVLHFGEPGFMSLNIIPRILRQ